MNQSEKETILAKLQEQIAGLCEMQRLIREMDCQEATLFDQVTPTITTSGLPASETPIQEKPRRTRTRAKDGTMTAATMAHALSKELGREITKDSVIRVAKQIKMKPTYCVTQHTSRYSSEAVNTIMNLYRSFNQ